MSRKVVCPIVFMLCSCVSNATDVQPSKMVSDFYHMSKPEQIEQFRSHGLDEQYELYVFGSQIVHPPAIYLADQFAQQGAAIIPFLRRKLEAEDEEARIRDITVIFSEVARLKLYDFSKDAELVRLLYRKVGNMQGIWKTITTEYLSEILAEH